MSWLGQAGIVFAVSVLDSTLIAALISGVFLFANTLLTHILVRRERKWERDETRRLSHRRRNGANTPDDFE